MTGVLRNCVLGLLMFCASAALAQQPARPGVPAGPGARVGSPVAPPAASAPAAAQPASNDLPALDELTATRERPLFSSTRRPPEVEPPAQVAAPIVDATSMPFELVGIVIGSELSAAIFRNTESKEETRVAKGEKIGNWNVEEISERAVVLHGGEKRVRMRLFDESKGPGVKVGRIGESSEPDNAEASDSDDPVDEDISPSSSPQVRPATAQPKPPPSLQNKGQRPRRPNRGLPRQRQQP